MKHKQTTQPQSKQTSNTEKQNIQHFISIKHEQGTGTKTSNTTANQATIATHIKQKQATPHQDDQQITRAKTKQTTQLQRKHNNK